MDEEKRGDPWWWLAASDSAPERRKASSLENGKLPHVIRETADDDNQREGDDEEAQLLVLKDAETRVPIAVAVDIRFADLLSASASDVGESSHDQQQRRQQQQRRRNANSWEASSSAESCDGLSSSNVSSLLSLSSLESHASSYSSPSSANRVTHESEDTCQFQNEADLPRLEEGELASHNVDMMALWLESGSSASISSESKQLSDDDSSSMLRDAAKESSDQPSSVSRSASLEDLESSSVDALSSLSSFSVQSGMCAISSPRRIENIPVAPVVRANVWDLNGDDSRFATYTKCWLEHEFVKPDALLSQCETEPRHRRLKPDREDTRRKLKKRLTNPHEHTCVNAINNHQMQFVSPDAELFVKFSELHGILIDHVPRRHGFFLDVGCGTSAVCREMVLHGYNRVYGIDIAAAKLAFQREQCEGLHQFVRFQAMDACELEFPDQLFDCIFSKATLDIVASNCIYKPTINDDLDELQQILREIWRCLQPGGVWIIVSCHGSRSAHMAPLDHNDSSSSSSDADASERLHKPWWEWRGVHKFIERRYDLAKSYGAGIPLIQDGKRVKPFIVMVFKRKEASRQQHLRRLYRNQMEETRSEWEFALVMQWHLEKRRWHAEEASTVRETREMVVEDAATRCRESELLYQSGMQARKATRAEIYRAMFATDRVLMTAEDAFAAAVRAEATALVAFSRKVLLDVADSAAALALVKESERDAAAVAVVEKELGADKGTGAEAAASPHQAEMKTAVTISAASGSDSSTVDSSLTVGNTIQSAELATSTTPDDSLGTTGGVQKTGEVRGESAIAISGHESLRKLEHILAQETVAPAAIEDRPVADRVEQVSAGQNREDSKDNAIGDSAQCAENIKKSELPVAAGDSSETNYTTTDESEQFGDANMTLVDEAKRVIDNKVEAAASASTIVAEDLPAVTTNA